MNIDNFVAVSGLPGLYKIVSNRSNGLVLEDLTTGKVKFASTRQYQFNPIGSIGIYINDEDETAPLADVFKSMLEKLETNPPVDPNSDKASLMEYFEIVMPNFDQDRVYPSDVKRLIKWFTFLNKHDQLSLEEEVTEEEVEAAEEVKQEEQEAK